MKISILTLFPQMFQGPFQESILKHAQEKGIVSIKFLNIRDFGIGKHQLVDDTPFGGGQGMLMRVDVLHAAIEEAIDKTIPPEKQRVIYLGAAGKTFAQEAAKDLTRYEHLILLCGHYEGVDERTKQYIDEEISIGDFILTGGEIPAMLVVDAVTRLLPGVLKDGVTDTESFSLQGEGQTKLIEYPQYTQPREYEGKQVPDVLLSGNHQQIETWRIEKSREKTENLRPDLLKKDLR
jgi:tRNA (guanine37-N1)-methyltransferase